jgi:outer membrane protein TolC
MMRFLLHATRLTAASICYTGVITTAAYAQTPTPIPTEPMTLEQVLELAPIQSESIAIARQGVQRAELEQAKARSGRFPQLNLLAAYDRALASEFDDVFADFGNGGNGQDGGASFEDLPFGRVNTWRATLSVSQTLFSGGRLGAQAALAEAGRDSAALALTTAQAQLLFDVTRAYYDAALSDRLVAIAEATVEQASATLQTAQAGFNAGTQPEFEVLRARVSRDTQHPVVIRQRVNREVALLRLKQMLNLPPQTELRLADALADEALPPPPGFAERIALVESRIDTSDPIKTTLYGDIPFTQRTVEQEAEVGIRLREAALRAAEAERRPSITLNSNYGRVSYPSGPFWGFSSLPTNWTVGVMLQMPLLTGGRLQSDTEIAEANLEEARLRLRQVNELAEVDTRAAWAELLAARAAWEATAGTVEVAARAYEIADVRYRAGVSTQVELSDARLLLQQAEANRVQAARDLQIARARVALLPNLPLGTTVPGGVVQPQLPAPVTPAPQQPQQPAAAGTQIRNASVQGGAPFGGGQ